MPGEQPPWLGGWPRTGARGRPDRSPVLASAPSSAGAARATWPCIRSIIAPRAASSDCPRCRALSLAVGRPIAHFFRIRRTGFAMWRAHEGLAAALGRSPPRPSPVPPSPLRAASAASGRAPRRFRASAGTAARRSAPATRWSACDPDVDVRGHARLELELGVRHVDHRCVGHDVLLRRSAAGGPAPRCRRNVVRIGVDAESHLCSGRMRPTSDSSRLARTCIFVRSAASTNSVGACMLAATVCPMSTLREMTRPSIGAVITRVSRLTWFWLATPAPG